MIWAVVILAIAFVLTLAALFCVLVGSANMVDEERKRTDAAEARALRLESDRRDAIAAKNVAQAALHHHLRKHEPRLRIVADATQMTDALTVAALAAGRMGDQS